LNRQHLLTAYNDHLIDPLPSSLEVAVTNRIHPLALKTATILHHQTETLFSVPMTLETVVLYYNKLFIETPHSTYEDLLTDALQWNETETSHESGLTNAELGWYYLGLATHWTDSYLLQHIYSSFDFFPFGLDSNDADEIGFIHAVEPLEWLINEL